MLNSPAASMRVQQLRDLRGQQRVRENVERLIEVGAAMVRGDADAEADLVQRDRRIIDGRNPEAALAKLVSEAIQILAPTTDHDRHDIGSGVPRIDAK